MPWETKPDPIKKKSLLFISLSYYNLRKTVINVLYRGPVTFAWDVFCKSLSSCWPSPPLITPPHTEQGSRCTNRAPGNTVPKTPAVNQDSLSMKVAPEGSTARFTPVPFDYATSVQPSVNQVGGSPCIQQTHRPTPTSPVCDCKSRLAKSNVLEICTSAPALFITCRIKKGKQVNRGSSGAFHEG